MEQIMLTILCLSYNHEKYIGQTIENFVNQKTNFKFQIIIHDDASKDQSQQIIREYARKYPDMIETVLQTENQRSVGGGSIYPRFINPLIKGKYIALCEGDDYWCDSDKLQKQVDFLEKHPDYSMCVHNSLFLDMTTNKSKHFNSTLKEDTDIAFDDIVDGVANQFHTSSWVYRTDFHFSMPEFCTSIRGVGDYPKALYMAAIGKIRYLSGVMSVYRYRSTPTSWTSKNNRNTVQYRTTYVDQRVEMLTMLKEEYPDRTESVDRAIKRKRFELVKMHGDYQLVKTDSFYKELYTALSFSEKLKFFIRHFTNGKSESE